MKKFLGYIIVTVIIIELVFPVTSATISDGTGFKRHLNSEPFDDEMPYGDRDSLVGVWHKPLDYWVNNGACFTAVMRSNKYGATDNEWDTGKPGYFFAGSSFVEGFGVEYMDRMSEKFEELTGKEVFNAGMSGTFNAVQYFMTIKKFENILNFDTCFIFLVVPADEELLTTVDSSRYRPYWKNDSIIYQTRTTFTSHKNVFGKCQLAVKQYSYVYHLYDFFKNRNTQKAYILGPVDTVKKKFNYLGRINELFCRSYPNKIFYFVLIPTIIDNSAIPFSFEKSFTNCRLLDLRNSLDRHKDFFICNPHWNKTGHEQFAKELRKAISQN